MNLDSKQKVDGTFWYLLDDVEPFQLCMLFHLNAPVIKFSKTVLMSTQTKAQ